MKKNLFAAVLVSSILASSAFAGDKQMACLEMTEETLVSYHHVLYMYHKVTITRQKSGQLRGNYTYSPKGQMNYGSVDVAFDASEAKWESTGPSKSIRSFELVVSNEPVEADVVDAYGSDGSYRVSGKLVGFRAFLRVVRLVADGVETRETQSLICNPNERKLFVKD